MATPPQVNERAGNTRSWPASLQATSNTMSASTGANSAAAVTLQGSTTGVIGGAATTPPVVLANLWWSYGAAPTGGRLTVVTGADTILDVDITAGGPGFINFNPPLSLYAGTQTVITLAAGGSGVTGKVGCNAWQPL